MATPVKAGYLRAIGMYKTEAEAEKALIVMRESSVNMDHVSVVARGADEVSGVETGITDGEGNKASEGAATGAVTGGLLGGGAGLLVGLGVLAIPGIGPILLAGAEATAIATTLAGGAIGATAGGLLGALIGLGIPEEDAKVYNERVTRGEYLIMVNGPETEVRKAEMLMKRFDVEEFKIYGSQGSALDNPDNLKLYEERLVAHKERMKTGEVSVSKRVATETQQVSVPVQKEKLVIEVSPPGNTVVTGSAAGAFATGDTVNIDLHEDQAVAGKQAFVRQEVSIRKETEQGFETVIDTVRHEELEVDSSNDAAADSTVIRKS